MGDSSGTRFRYLVDSGFGSWLTLVSAGGAAFSLWCVAPGEGVARVGGARGRGTALSGGARGVEPGASVTDVAPRYGVTRQTVHRWLRGYALGAGGLADRIARPLRVRIRWRGWSRRRWCRCGGSIRGGVHARSCVAWPRGFDRCRPGRRSIGLVRHGLIEPARVAATPGLQAMGTVPVDGVVADGRHRSGLSR